VSGVSLEINTSSSLGTVNVEFAVEPLSFCRVTCDGEVIFDFNMLKRTQRAACSTTPEYREYLVTNPKTLINAGLNGPSSESRPCYLIKELKPAKFMYP
jgi:hypothetical protein